MKCEHVLHLATPFGELNQLFQYAFYFENFSNYVCYRTALLCFVCVCLNAIDDGLGYVWNVRFKQSVHLK